MLLKELREQVLEANLELVRRGLVLYTFGNASGIDREQGLVVIKPSGVDYDELLPEHMVVTDLHGKIVEGDLKPSSDLDTHTLLYREFPTIGAVVHTHSEFATSFAQAGLPIPPLGTTHADYFYGPVPCTAPLTDEAIGGRYVHETGLAIVNHFQHTDELASTRSPSPPASSPATPPSSGAARPRRRAQRRRPRSRRQDGLQHPHPQPECRRRLPGPPRPPLLPQTRRQRHLRPVHYQVISSQHSGDSMKKLALALLAAACTLPPQPSPHNSRFRLRPTKFPSSSAPPGIPSSGPNPAGMPTSPSWSRRT